MPNNKHGSPHRQAGHDVAALVKVQGAHASLSKKQREFNRLSGQLQRARAMLAQWEAWEQRYLERTQHEMLPATSALRDAQRRLVYRVDAMLGDPNSLRGLNKKHCATLRDLLTDVTQMLLAHAPDAELAALHDKHSEHSLDELRRQDFEFAQSVAASVLGDEVVEGHAAADVDELFEHISDRVSERVAAEEQARAARSAERAAKRGRQTPADRAAERHAQSAKAAGESVREVYRKLASSLHPDRETDPLERERKTALMQRANQAYAADDILALLQLQLEIEQIDATHLASVPETRIKHYIHVLGGQLHALQQQLLQVGHQNADRIGVDYALRDPRAANTAFDHVLAEIKTARRQIDRDLRDLDDPRKRRALLDALVEEAEAFDNPLDGNFDALMAMLDDAPPAGKGRRRR